MPRGVDAMQAWHVIFWVSGFFDLPFLAESGGEKQDDGLGERPYYLSSVK